jgi:hypothetical protein
MAKKNGGKKARATVPENETKGAKFVRLAQKRTGKALNAIRQIGQLSGAGYESNDEQIKKIFAALSDAAKQAYERFESKGSKEKAAGFTL